MLEILFFAILSGYLFFRLWSVLGERTGFEKTFDRKSDSMVDVTPQSPSKDTSDNIIHLPPRDSTSHEGRKYQPTINTTGFEDALEKIQSEDPTFKLEDFLDKASAAFELITISFAEGDKNTLQQLLTKKAYDQFENVIDQRRHNGAHISNDIVGPIYSKIENITVKGSTALITLIFTSDQRYITYDTNGKILDNPEKITIKMTSAWTFERDVKNSGDYTWYLSQTRVMD